jgi:hypothetical protein
LTSYSHHTLLSNCSRYPWHCRGFSRLQAIARCQPLCLPLAYRRPAVFTVNQGNLQCHDCHLTAPSTLRPPTHGAVPHSMHSVASRLPTIENNLSLPVRHALSVRMGVTRLSRPSTVPRSIAQVGLGTARNFTGPQAVRSSRTSPTYRRTSTSLSPRRQRREYPSHTTFSYTRHPLFPFLELLALRVDTERQASRVRALFERLDFAQAWDKGSTCETLGVLTT